MLKVIIKLISIFFILIIFLILFNYSIRFFISKKFFRNNKKRLMRKVILSKIFKKTRKNINNISSLFIKGNARFGNLFLTINNAIIHCEILDCKKIIIENSNNIYINKTIFYKKGNFIIEPTKELSLKDNYTIILDFYYYLFNGFALFRKANRLNIFKEQLLNNLPKIVVHPNDLCIYIRSGDIFIRTKSRSILGYYQPPLCFYANILNKFKFHKVFIISEDKLNPVIQNLLIKYTFIKKVRNNLKLDISYLINSYNIVSAKSTLFSASIKFNDKLKFLWEYDFYSSKRNNNFPFYYTIYKMNSSNNYKRIMIPWANLPNQRKIMIKEKCINNFDIIKL